MKAQELDIVEIADRYAEAWKSHDVSQILAMHAENSTFQAHGRTGEVRGEAALRAEFAQIFERYPGFDVEEPKLLPGDRHWTLEWTLSFQPSGGGARRGFRALDVVEVDAAGRVTRKDTWFDFAQLKAAMS